MSTITVTPEVETPRHFADCDSLAIGRRVKVLIEALGEDWKFDLGSMTVNLDEFRGQCQCFALQLTRVEADLAARRKAQRAGYDREAEIEQLLVARDALRQAVAR